MLIKKRFIKICSILLAAAFITGCSGKTTDDTSGGNINDEAGYEEDGETFISKETGLIFNIPEKYQEKGIEIEKAGEDVEGHVTIGVMWYYRPVTDKIFTDMKEYSNGDYTDEMVQDFWDKMNIHSKYLMEISLIEEQEYKEIKAGKPDAAASLAGAEELGTNGGYMYLVTTPENNTDGMSEEEKAQYEECMDYMETLKQNLEFTDIEKNAGLPDKMPSFTTKDIKGNTITDDIFKEKDLTIVNIWGTFCGPCIEEMPELGEWAESMPDNIQLIGLVCDIEGESDSTHKELATEIMEKAGADFTNIIPDSSFDTLLKWVTGVPTTIFVDKEGNITGEPVIGADVDSYKKFAEDYINGK